MDTVGAERTSGGRRRSSYDAAVTRRASPVRAPRDYVLTGVWPDGELSDDEPAAAYAAHIAAALGVALAGRNKSEVAAAAGLARSTLYDMIEGRTWGDLISIARLEAVLDARLWPREQPRG